MNKNFLKQKIYEKIVRDKIKRGEILIIKKELENILGASEQELIFNEFIGGCINLLDLQIKKDNL